MDHILMLTICFADLRMNKEFLTQTVHDNTNIIDSDDNWNLLLLKEDLHVKHSALIFEHWFKSQ